MQNRNNALRNRSGRAAAPVLLFFTVLLAGAVAAPVAAGARGAFDGTWNVTFTPQQGNCFNSYNAPFIVSGGRLKSGGGGKVTGGVRPNGTVAVRLSVGLSHADGTGKLSAKSGTGRWSGLITGDQCSGVWQATRS